MLQIQNHKTTGVVGRGTAETDTATTGTAGNIGAINANVNGAARCANQTIAAGGRLIDVGDIALGGVGALGV